MTSSGAAAPTLASADEPLLAFAQEVGDDGPVAVEGGRTRWDLGGAAVAGTRLVRAPAGIVSYAPEEMTVTVRAGTTVSELHRVLAERGQRSALPDRDGTVGGALVAGENDVRALGRGLLRTCLLQVRYISAEGRVVSSGGPTVKNVSGFDLPRLMVGSLGTLGLVAEAIIRTNPMPAVSRWLVSDDADPFAVFAAVLAPGAVLWDGSSTWVQLEGHPQDVDAEQAKLQPLGRFEEVAADGGGAAGLPISLPSNRWSLTPADLIGLDGRADELGLGRFVAVVGLGLVLADGRQPARTMAPEVEVVATRLKENFDPTGRLNPGRDPGRK